MECTDIATEQNKPSAGLSEGVLEADTSIGLRRHMHFNYSGASSLAAMRHGKARYHDECSLLVLLMRRRRCCLGMWIGEPVFVCVFDGAWREGMR